jgi:hypothetical protein
MPTPAPPTQPVAASGAGWRAYLSSSGTAYEIYTFLPGVAPHEIAVVVHEADGRVSVTGMCVCVCVCV